MTGHRNLRWVMVTLVVLSASIVQIRLHAATMPLNKPRGLALDSHGNLYVANQNGNNILVYNSSYVQEKAIVTGVSQPSGVAIDSLGNLYVLNRGTSSISLYNSTGQWYIDNDITSGIDNPWGIALDGLNNLYVSNNFTTISMYVPVNPTGQSAVGFGDYYPAYFPIGQYETPYDVFAIAAHGPYLSYGSVQNFWEYVAAGVLTNTVGTIGPYRYGSEEEVLALAYDTKGDLYTGDVEGNLQVLAAGTETPSLLVNVGFAIEGIAVDAVHSHVYLSNETDNQIAVYSLTGELLTVIK